MGRPKKEKPTHSSGMYRYCKTVGHNFDGSPIKKVFYSKKSKADAKRIADEYTIDTQLAAERGEIFAATTTTFKKVTELYLKSAKATLSPKSYYDYEIIIHVHLLPFFGDAVVNSIKPTDVQRYFSSISGKSPLESMRKYKAVLNIIFNYAENNGYCTKNPCHTVKLKSTVKTEEKDVYSKEEAEKVSEYAKKYKFPDGIAIELMLDYGMRKGEVLGLHTNDIDFKNKYLTVNHSVGDVRSKETNTIQATLQPPKNKSSRRIIPLSDDILSRLKGLPTGYIIQNRKGTFQSPNNWTKRNYKKFMESMNKDLGIKILKPHELRHTRATIWVNEGKNIFAVASILGHSDLKMLEERYAHKDVDEIRNQLGI